MGYGQAGNGRRVSVRPSRYCRLFRSAREGRRAFAPRSGLRPTCRGKRNGRDLRSVSCIASSALAYLGLARAFVLQGDTLRAKAAYQNFLTLWKDADPDIPILKEAKAEYAKLQ